MSGHTSAALAGGAELHARLASARKSLQSLRSCVSDSKERLYVRLFRLYNISEFTYLEYLIEEAAK